MLVKTTSEETLQHTCQRGEGRPAVYLHDIQAYMIIDGKFTHIKYCPYCGIEIDTENRPGRAVNPGTGGKEMERTISIEELKKSKVETWSVKDNSVRGYTTKHTNEVKQGDKVVIKNYFTLVI